VYLYTNLGGKFKSFYSMIASGKSISDWIFLSGFHCGCDFSYEQYTLAKFQSFANFPFLVLSVDKANSFRTNAFENFQKPQPNTKSVQFYLKQDLALADDQLTNFVGDDTLVDGCLVNCWNWMQDHSLISNVGALIQLCKWFADSEIIGDQEFFKLNDNCHFRSFKGKWHSGEMTHPYETDMALCYGLQVSQAISQAKDQFFGKDSNHCSEAFKQAWKLYHHDLSLEQYWTMRLNAFNRIQASSDLFEFLRQDKSELADFISDTLLFDFLNNETLEKKFLYVHGRCDNAPEGLEVYVRLSSCTRGNNFVIKIEDVLFNTVEVSRKCDQLWVNERVNINVESHSGAVTEFEYFPFEKSSTLGADVDVQFHKKAIEKYVSALYDASVKGDVQYLPGVDFDELHKNGQTLDLDLAAGVVDQLDQETLVNPKLQQLKTRPAVSEYLVFADGNSVQQSSWSITAMTLGYQGNGFIDSIAVYLLSSGESKGKGGSNPEVIFTMQKTTFRDMIGIYPPVARPNFNSSRATVSSTLNVDNDPLLHYETKGFVSGELQLAYPFNSSPISADSIAEVSSSLSSFEFRPNQSGYFSFENGPLFASAAGLTLRRDLQSFLNGTVDMNHPSRIQSFLAELKFLVKLEASSPFDRQTEVSYIFSQRDNVVQLLNAWACLRPEDVNSLACLLTRVPVTVRKKDRATDRQDWRLLDEVRFHVVDCSDLHTASFATQCCTSDLINRPSVGVDELISYRRDPDERRFAILIGLNRYHWYNKGLLNPSLSGIWRCYTKTLVPVSLENSVTAAVDSSCVSEKVIGCFFTTSIDAEEV